MLTKSINKNNFITAVLLLFTILLSTSNTTAQSKKNPNWISFYAGYNGHKASLSESVFYNDLSKNMGFGVELNRYLNTSFDLSMSFFRNNSLSDLQKTGGKVFLNSLGFNYKPQRSNVRFNGSLLGKYKFTNNHFFSSESIIHPYVFAGVGFTNSSRSRADTNADVFFQLPAGAGLDISLSEIVRFSLRTTYNRTFFTDSNGNSNHTDFLLYTIGATFNLGKNR